MPPPPSGLPPFAARGTDGGRLPVRPPTVPNSNVPISLSHQLNDGGVNSLSLGLNLPGQGKLAVANTVIDGIMYQPAVFADDGFDVRLLT